MILFITRYAMTKSVLKKTFLVLTLMISSSIALWGQIDTLIYYHIDTIEIKGLKRTKLRYIMREMDIASKDSLRLPDLKIRLDRNEQMLLNTGLFSRVKINITKWDDRHLSLKITVSEVFYIAPMPNIELADRNFNVWWVEQRHQLNRLNFGLWLAWKNFTGNNDVLKMAAQLGYTQKYEIAYRRPFIDKKQRWGMSVNLLFSRNKEIAYNSEGNKLLFFRDFEKKTFQYKRWRAGISFTRRQGFYVQHEFGARYQVLSISDTSAILNPDFFLGGRTIQKTVNLEYRLTIDRRNIRPYPTKGFIAELNLLKTGFWKDSDVRMLQIKGSFGQYFKLSPHWHVSLGVKARKTLANQKIPFYNSTALGYESDYVRGYQYYVVNGLDYALFQTDLHRNIFDRDIILKKSFLKKVKRVPMRLYLRWHGDTGYVRDRDYAAGNPLSNRWLFGTGLSFDAVLFFNSVLQFDYSINHLGEHGFYLRQKFKF